MKTLLRNLCSPLLDYFESGEEEYVYKSSHRTILKVVGFLFLALSIVSLSFSIAAAEVGGIIPFLVFLSVGIVCEVVGFLGQDRAVAKIWRNK